MPPSSPARTCGSSSNSTTWISAQFLLSRTGNMQVTASSLPRTPNGEPSRVLAMRSRRLVPVAAASVFPVWRRSWKCSPGFPILATAVRQSTSWLKFPRHGSRPLGPVKTNASGSSATCLQSPPRRVRAGTKRAPANMNASSSACVRAVGRCARRGDRCRGVVEPTRYVRFEPLFAAPLASASMDQRVDTSFSHGGALRWQPEMPIGRCRRRQPPPAS
jgi:hypothetical protein